MQSHLKPHEGELLVSPDCGREGELLGAHPHLHLAGRAQRRAPRPLQRVLGEQRHLQHAGGVALLVLQLDRLGERLERVAQHVAQV